MRSGIERYDHVLTEIVFADAEENRSVIFVDHETRSPGNLDAVLIFGPSISAVRYVPSVDSQTVLAIIRANCGHLKRMCPIVLGDGPTGPLQRIGNTLAK